jgi:hypothetical protein
MELQDLWRPTPNRVIARYWEEDEETDYSSLSPIEPSSIGGMKIATRIAAVVKTSDFRFPRTVIF